MYLNVLVATYSFPYFASTRHFHTHRFHTYITRIVACYTLQMAFCRWRLILWRALKGGFARLWYVWHVWRPKTSFLCLRLEIFAQWLLFCSFLCCETENCLPSCFIRLLFIYTQGDNNLLLAIKLFLMYLKRVVKNFVHVDFYVFGSKEFSSCRRH